jgi:hypothetical protein
MSSRSTCCQPSRAGGSARRCWTRRRNGRGRAGLAGLSLSTFREIPWNAPYYRRLGFVEVAALTPGIWEIRAEHLARGLDEDARVFMVRDV